MFANAVLSVYAGILIFAALSDVTRLRIPNNVPLALLALYPLHLLSIADPMTALPALGLAAAVFAIGFFFFARGWMGGGDVKLLSVGMLWAGPDLAFDFFFVTSVMGGVQAVLYILPLRSWLPGWANVAIAALPSAGAAVSGAVTAQSIPAGKQRRLPYGLAIACGGLYVAARLSGLLAA